MVKTWGMALGWKGLGEIPVEGIELGIVPEGWVELEAWGCEGASYCEGVLDHF